MSEAQSIIARRLKQALSDKGLNAAELARLAEVKTSFIYDVLSGKSLNPSTVTLARVASVLNVSLPYLAGTEAATPVSSTKATGEVVSIPRIRIAASAGGGTIVTTEEATLGDEYYFRRDWISNHLKTSPQYLRLLDVTGDSMHPTLQDGDIILVDTSRGAPSPPGIFVLFDGVGLVAKRLELEAQSKPPAIRIMSDNPQYPSYTKSIDETRVIGRVVWFAREL